MTAQNKPTLTTDETQLELRALNLIEDNDCAKLGKGGFIYNLIGILWPLNFLLTESLSVS